MSRYEVQLTLSVDVPGRGAAGLSQVPFFTSQVMEHLRDTFTGEDGYKVHGWKVTGKPRLIVKAAGSLSGCACSRRK